MKKAFLPMLLLFSLLFCITAQAAEWRAASAHIDLDFDGSVAVCSSSCIGNKGSDNVSATMTLYQGSKKLTSWSSSDQYRVSMSGKRYRVTEGNSYTLTLTYSINGVQQTSKSVTKTCS